MRLADGDEIEEILEEDPQTNPFLTRWGEVVTLSQFIQTINGFRTSALSDSSFDAFQTVWLLPAQTDGGLTPQEPRNVDNN